MQILLRHQPAYSVARVQLEPNEALQLEAGAMVAMSSGVELTSKMEGGFLSHCHAVCLVAIRSSSPPLLLVRMADG